MPNLLIMKFIQKSIFIKIIYSAMKNNLAVSNVVLGPLCYKLFTVVNCYLETGLSCIVY